MPVLNLELNARGDVLREPVIWRLSRLFNVVTNIRRARVSQDYGYVLLEVEGSTAEVEQTKAYLAALGIIAGDADQTLAGQKPETAIPQPNAIYVRLTSVAEGQGGVPVLHRIGKDLGVVVNLQKAEFDEEEGGWIEVTISGVLFDVQRSIAYLHTTGIHVNPRERSVTDYSNL